MVRRLRLTGLSAVWGASAVASLTVLVLAVVSAALVVIGVGLLSAWFAVRARDAIVSVHRRLVGDLLGLSGGWPAADAARPRGLAGTLRHGVTTWRGWSLLAFASSLGPVMSVVVVWLLLGPFAYLVLMIVDDGSLWPALFVISIPLVGVWWVATPRLVRTRAEIEAAILGSSSRRRLAERLDAVEQSRTESLDHAAAEVRRIERDLHDGAQARLAAVGMSVGLAEKLVRSDPETAAELLREARETTVAALEDIRSVVRGIHPPVLADRGLAGAIDALALAVPLPITVAVELPRRYPASLESALYFAVAECIANAVKHSAASGVRVTGEQADRTIRLRVADDGAGGADADGHGLAGVRRRLSAFDGSLEIDSPDGGPTTVTMEVAWTG